MIKKTTLYFRDEFHKNLKIMSAETGESMTEIIKNAVEEKYFKEENKMYKIIDVIEFNKNGIDKREEHLKTAKMWFDDRGQIISGNYDEEKIEDTWVILSGTGFNEFGIYAERAEESMTLVPLKEFLENKKRI